ncbi:MAG: hypothetical protein ACRD72_09835 [Candidatus Angelobacter sp.]
MDFRAAVLLTAFFAGALFLAADFFGVGFFLLTGFFLRAGFFLAMGKVYQTSTARAIVPLLFLPSSVFLRVLCGKGFDFQLGNLAYPPVSTITTSRMGPCAP